MGNSKKTSELDTLQTRYLEVLSEMYPSIASASTEIINLQAILNLPKGTEHVLGLSMDIAEHVFRPFRLS